MTDPTPRFIKQHCDKPWFFQFVRELNTKFHGILSKAPVRSNHSRQLSLSFVTSYQLSATAGYKWYQNPPRYKYSTWYAIWQWCLRSYPEALV